MLDAGVRGSGPDRPQAGAHLQSVANRRHEHLRLGRAYGGTLLLGALAQLRLHDGEDTLDADGHAHGRHVLAAEHAHQPVVAPAWGWGVTGRVGWGGVMGLPRSRLGMAATSRGKCKHRHLCCTRGQWLSGAVSKQRVRRETRRPNEHRTPPRANVRAHPRRWTRRWRLAARSRR